VAISDALPLEATRAVMFGLLLIWFTSLVYLCMCMLHWYSVSATATVC